MRDPQRIDRIVEQLRTVWKRAPELRLGQMLLNVAGEPKLYYIEDQQLIDLLTRHLGQADPK